MIISFLRNGMFLCCKRVLIALQTGADYKVIWCRLQCDLHRIVMLFVASCFEDDLMLKGYTAKVTIFKLC